MISFVYITSTIISLAVLIYVLSRSRYQNTYFMLMQLVTLLSNLGYVAFARATVIEEALLAIKIYYVGGCFLNLFVFFICCDICQIKLAKWIRYVTAGMAIFAYFMVWTIGYSDIYYKSATLYFFEGVVRVQKEYGPMHNVYSLVIYGLAVANIGVLLYALARKKNVSRNAVITLGAIEVGSMIIYVAQRAANIPFDLMPVVYIVIVIMCAALIDRQAYFDVTVNKMREMSEEGVAYVFFDRKLKLMAYDDGALDILGSLRENNIGEKISVMNGDFEHQVVAWITESVKDKKFSEAMEKSNRGKTYEFEVNPLKDDVGYYVLMKQKAVE